MPVCKRMGREQFKYGITAAAPCIGVDIASEHPCTFSQCCTAKVSLGASMLRPRKWIVCGFPYRFGFVPPTRYFESPSLLRKASNKMILPTDFQSFPPLAAHTVSVRGRLAELKN